MAIRVRHLEPKDRAAWEPLFRGYLEFYESSLTDEMIGTTWDRLHSEEAEFHTGLVAVGDDDVPVGLAHICFIARRGRRPFTAISKTCSWRRNCASRALAGR